MSIINKEYNTLETHKQKRIRNTFFSRILAYFTFVGESTDRNENNYCLIIVTVLNP